MAVRIATRPRGTSWARLAAAVALALGLAALLWWQRSDGAGAAAEGDRKGPAAHAGMPLASVRTDARSGAGAADAVQKPLSPDVFQAIPDALGSAAGATPADKLQSARARLRAQFPVALHASVLGLLDRYVAFHEALMAQGADGMRDPGSFRRYIALRDRLRQNYFSAEEIRAFWADENPAERYMGRRLEILADEKLSEAQRAAALRQAEEASFPPQELAARRESVQYQDVIKQTQDFEARGLPPEQRFALREQAYGAESASRLEEMDRQEQDWARRLAQYEAAAEDLKPALAQQLFTPQEQLRLKGAMELRRAARP